MRSLTLLRFAHSPYRIEEIARDYNAHYMSAVEAISGKDGADKGEYIGAETDFNLFTVMKENTTNARSMADEYSLSPRAAFHLGEMVSKFKHGLSFLSSVICVRELQLISFRLVQVLSCNITEMEVVELLLNSFLLLLPVRSELSWSLMMPRRRCFRIWNEICEE